MLRTLRVVCAVAGLGAVSGGAAAQTASDSCPPAPLSIYFASGDIKASPQTEALIVRIGDTATRCQADTIDLVAHIDFKVDGERAVTIALERLAKVAHDLVARGLPADRIRVAARAPMKGEPVAGPNQINVLIRKSEGATQPAAPGPARTAPSQSI
jgi:outer membrane protein OmpA-like peptidoglycan-associated protein